MNLSAWCTKIIRTSFYLLFILVPLILTPWNYELFEYNKMMVTYALTAVIATAWFVKMIADREIKVLKTPLDIPLWLFVGSQLVSALFSWDPHVSWLGYYSRFNGGMWSVVCYAFLYHAFTTNFINTPLSHESGTMNDESRKKSKEKSSPSPLFIIHNSLFSLLKVILATAVVVAAYGIAEHFGIDKHLWVQDVQNRVFSSLGQPNWLAAYLVALIPIAIAFALPRVKSGGKTLVVPMGTWLAGALTLVLFVTLLFTRSRSGLVGLAVADAIFWIATLLGQKARKHIIKPAVILHVIFGLIIFINGSNISQIDQYVSLESLRNRFIKRQSVSPKPAATPAGPSLETGGTESGTIRTYVWQGAVDAWKSSTKTLLIGTGTETFAFAFYRFRPTGHNLTSEWDFLYNKAHNEYLNYLATTGAIGLGTYLLFIGAFIVWFIKHQRIDVSMHQRNSNDTPDTSDTSTLSLALFAGWASLLVTNFFGFSVVIVQLLFFLLPACVVVRSQTAETLSWHKKRLRMSPAALTTLLVAAGVTQIIILSLHWEADRSYATAYRLARSGNYAAAVPQLTRAIGLNTREPVYHDELANTLSALSVAAFEAQNATLAADLARQSLAENDKAILTSPKNVNFWKTRTKIYYAFSGYDPSLNAAAVEALTHARDLSPNDPKIYYNLAILVGRGGDIPKAIAYLEKSKELKPNYHDAYFGLYIFFMELKQADRARAVLTDYLTNVDAKDQQFLELLATQ